MIARCSYLTLLGVLLAMAGPARAQSGAPGTLGLEMRLAPVRSAGGALPSALQRFESNPTGIDDESERRLHASGLRAVAVPVDLLDEALGALQSAGPMQREWLGSLGSWTPIVTGPVLPDPATRIDSGEVNLGPGRFRLLARCWLVPDLTEAQESGVIRANLRVELVPQHLPDHPRRLEQLLEPTIEGRVSDGQVLHRLKLSCDLPSHMALLIVPTSGQSEWASAQNQPPAAPPTQTDLTQTGPTPPGPVGPDPQAEQAGAPSPAPRTPVRSIAPPGTRPIGPTDPQARTLGEQLLRTPGAIETEGARDDSVRVRPERSVVLVLMAHTPDRYRLVP